MAGRASTRLDANVIEARAGECRRVVAGIARNGGRQVMGRHERGDRQSCPTRVAGGALGRRPSKNAARMARVATGRDMRTRQGEPGRRVVEFAARLRLCKKVRSNEEEPDCNQRGNNDFD